MKSAKEWMSRITTDEDIVAPSVYIPLIQSDAYKAGLLRAVQLCKDIASQLGRADDHWIIERAQRDIQAEAHKEATKEAK